MGLPKTEIRHKLAKADLLSLMKHNSLDEISKMFGCSVTMVGLELQNLFNNKRIGFVDYEKNINNEDYLLKNGSPKVDGSWINSQERVLIKNYKQ